MAIWAVLFSVFVGMIDNAGAQEAFKIAERSSWCKDGCKLRGIKHTIDDEEANRIILHNLNFPALCGPEAVASFYQARIQLSPHVDIGVHYIVDRCGQVFEGLPQNYVADFGGTSGEYLLTNKQGYNPHYRSISIGFLGVSFQALRKEQVGAAMLLIDELRKQNRAIERLNTSDQIKFELIKKGLTPVGNFDPEISPGIGSMGDFNQIKNAFSGVLQNDYRP